MQERVLTGVWLGCRPYAQVYALQLELLELRKAAAIGDLLLCLEHEPVITLGRGARAEHLLASAAQLAERGVALERTDRGGEITLHAPGQLVGYPIVGLAPERCDVRRYVRDLSATVCEALADRGVQAGDVPGRIGVWVDGANPGVWPGLERARAPEKIGAIGVRLSRWVSMHGFALNLSVDLDLFRLIVPCGIREYGVCSLASLGLTPPSPRELGPRVHPLLSARLARRAGDWLDLSELPLAELPALLTGKRPAARAQIQCG